MPHFIVGTAVNAEVVYYYDGSSPDEKIPLQDFSIQLSGSSGDVAIALSQLGAFSHLLGLIADKEDDQSALLRLALKKHRVGSTLLPCLDKTSIAVLPCDDSSEKSRVIGRRGDVIPERIPTIVNLITDEAACFEWRVATGVREREIAEALLGTNKGKRVLNPNFMLCQNQGLEALLPFVDILVLNKNEMAVSRMTFKKCHEAGTSLVIVTEDEDGGQYSLRGKVGRFAPVKITGNAFYPAGAGDWFLGGFLSFCELEHTDATSTAIDIERALAFGAKVAAKKISMKGAGNGPMLSEV